MFDFSLLRTHFCLITKYSVEFRAALRGNFARGAHVDEDVPKGGPGSDNSVFRMTLAGRMPMTLVHASSASALAQRPVRYLIFDEVSRFQVQSKVRVKEGDPLALERNEALDLMVMCLCILEMFRGTLDTMQPVIADQRRRTQRRFNSRHRRSSSMILSLRMHSGWCADLTTTHLALAQRPAVASSGNPRCQRLQDLTGLRCLA